MSIDEPLMSLWFGNFYRPAYDDQDFIDQSMRKIREIGFNTVLLDSKAWEDFQERYKGRNASQYVDQQEYMMQAAAQNGMGHMFLSLYLNGDNLYPNIRFSPPIHGDSVIGPDGLDGQWYKYWSDKAQLSMQQHAEGLLKTYRQGHAEIENNGAWRLPMCSMWDPVAAPSFDEEGRQRYRAWLRKRYGLIENFNRAYRTSFTAFSEIAPEEYWFSLKYGEASCYTLDDLRNETPCFVMWADNKRWLADEITLYFESMKVRLHGVEPSLYLMPNLSQWSHLLNVDTSRKSDIGLCELWDTAMRGIDMHAVAPHVDMAHYYTVPVTIDGDPDAYVVACQHAHIRSLNRGRMFYGGIFWGRFLYNDVYRYITPEEIAGSIVASGAKGICAYGMCGMDDGGLLHRMDEGFITSLSRANAWAKRVIPQLGGRRESRVAILYPSAMALLEPLKVAGSDMRRNDLLGLYRMCSDMGIAPDIVESEDAAHFLTNIDVLLIPADDCYHAQRSETLEKALKDFVEQGGVIVHGQYAEVAELAFSLNPMPTTSICYTYRDEGGLLLGAPFVSYPGEMVAEWRENEENCISCNRFGRGYVYSFGFMPGYQAAARTAPHVPLSQKNDELYPFVYMNRNPLRDVLCKYVMPDIGVGQKDVEYAVFEHGVIVVNHRSMPVRLPACKVLDAQQPMYDGLLSGHSAALIQFV